MKPGHKIKWALFGVVLLLGIVIRVGLANAEQLPDSLPDEVKQYQPETLLKDIERLEHKGKFSILESSYHTFFKRFNLINPTPNGILSSGADVGLNLFFDYFDAKDHAKKLREERYKLAKTRWGYRTFTQLFPDHAETPGAKENVMRLSKRITEIDETTQRNAGDVGIIPEEKRPMPKSWKWMLMGDDVWKDFGIAASSLVFGGLPSAIGIGVYEMLMISQRAYQAKTNGGFNREDWQIEIEYLAAFERIVPPEEKQRYSAALARAYEQEGSGRSLSKALAFYTARAEETKEKPETKDAKTDQANLKRIRERIASAIRSYAQDKGDREALEEVAREFAETEAGKKAQKTLDSEDVLEPLKKLARQISGGGRISVSGFDVYGSGYNLFGDDERISAGIANMDTLFGDMEVPYVSQWLGGRVPALRGGPGWFSFVLNPAREKPHRDIEFFLR